MKFNEKNVGKNDAIVRVAVALALFGAALAKMVPSPYDILLALLGAALLGTAVFGTCWLYTLLGISTAKK